MLGFDEAKNDSKFSSANGGEYAFISDSNPSTINILNRLNPAVNPGTPASNLVFTKSFGNVGGFTTIANQRGSLTTAANVVIEGGDVGHLELAATGGNLGSSGNRLKVQLVRGKLMPDNSLADMPAELVASGQNVYLDIIGVNTFAQPTSVADGFALHLTAVQDVDAVISRSLVADRGTLTADVILDTSTSRFTNATGLYNLYRADSATGHVSIVNNTGDLILGPLGSFLGPNGEVINAIVGLYPTLQNELKKGLVSASQGRVSLQATGTIRDDSDGIGLDILAQEAVLRAGTTLGSNANALETQIANLAAQVDGAELWLNNLGNLTIGEIAGLDGLSSAGDATLTTTGSLTVNARARANNTLWLRTIDAAIAGQDITLTDQARLESTAGTIDLLAGDNLTVAAGATITANGLLTLVGDHTDADAGLGTEINLHGSLSAAQVNVSGGSDSDTVNLSRAVSGVPLMIQTLGGNDVVNIGSNASTASNTGGVLAAIAGPITLDLGTGSNRLSLDDSGDTTANTGSLTATTITGLGLAAGITYANVSTLELELGSGSDAFTVASTHPGQTTLNAGAGDDAVTVESTTGTTVVNTGSGSDTITVGNPSGVVSQVDGLLILDAGGENDQIILNNSGDIANNSGTLTSTAITGLGMAQGIQYSNAESLELTLGSGGDSFTVASTHTGQTTLNSGAGADTVTAQSVAGVTYLNSQAGNDQSLISRL
ncbi:MAG: hypothetical protein HC929_06680 [Leptolyngbyaceae cyanobacterium SM2_5_2]|nr:hypothetical protein [Leptolyngbyaceae cyanobacterium SM2_5_2]